MHHCVVWAWCPVVIVETAPEVPGQLLRQWLPRLPPRPPWLPAFPRVPRLFHISPLLSAAPPEGLSIYSTLPLLY